MHGLGAGEAETHALEGRARGAEPLGELDLGHVLGADLLHARGRPRDGRRHAGVPVAEDDRPVAADVVDVLVAVLVHQVGARASRMNSGTGRSNIRNAVETPPARERAARAWSCRDDSTERGTVTSSCRLSGMSTF